MKTIIFLLLIANISAQIFGQSKFDCTNIASTDDEFLKNWKFIREELLCVKGSNIKNHKVGRAPAQKFNDVIAFFAGSEKNWFRKFDSKQIISGEIDSLYLFDTEEKLHRHVLESDHEIESDWNFLITPREKFKYLLATSKKDLDEWHKNKKDNFQIECEITPSESIILFNPFFSFTLSESKPEANIYTGNVFKPIKDNRICLYGPCVMEEVHEFRPEIHPVELVWFQNNVDNDKISMLAVQDRSNRFYDNDDFYEPEANFVPWSKPPIYAEFRYAFEIDPSNSKMFILSLEAFDNIYSNDDFEINSDKSFLTDNVTTLIYNGNIIGVIQKTDSAKNRIGVSFDTDNIRIDNRGYLTGYIIINCIVSKPALDESIGYIDDLPGYAFIELEARTKDGFITENYLREFVDTLIFKQDEILRAQNENDSLKKLFAYQEGIKSVQQSIKIFTSNEVNPVVKTKYNNLENHLSVYSKNEILNELKTLELEKVKDGVPSVKTIQFNLKENVVTTKEAIPIVKDSKLRFILENNDTLISEYRGMRLNHNINTDSVSLDDTFNYNLRTNDNRKAALLNKLNGVYQIIDQRDIEVYPKYFSNLDREEIDWASSQVDSLNSVIYSARIDKDKLKANFGEEKYPFKIEWSFDIYDVVNGEKTPLKIKTTSKSDLTKNSIATCTFPEELRNIPVVIECICYMNDAFGLKDTFDIKVYNYKIDQSNKETLIKRFFSAIVDLNQKDSTFYWKLANKPEDELNEYEKYEPEYINSKGLLMLLTHLIYNDPETMSDIEFLSSIKL